MDAITFNGKEYNLEPAMFASFQTAVNTQYETYAQDKRDAILGDMLKAFLKPGKDYAKVERAAEIKAMADTVNGHETVKPLAAKVSAAFKAYARALSPIEKMLGAKAKVNDSGTVSFALPIDGNTPITLGAIYTQLGLADVEIAQRDDGKVFAKVSGDVPDAAKHKVAYKEALGALDTAITGVIDRTNLKVGFNVETSLVELVDATQKQSGAHGGGNTSGTVSAGGSAKYRATGKVYSGTHQEIFDAAKKDGITFPDWAKPSHILGGKVSGWDVIERK